MKNQIAKEHIPSERELSQINQLTRRNLKPDEVYTFSVVLCDNQIDRDLERFSVDTLHTLAKLFVGKTGIFDHSMSGRDQVARIFSCKVERVEGKTTQTGEPYHRLKAKAYLPRIAKNMELIEELDAGIKKEVSISCAVAYACCSICGTDWRTEVCRHIKGRYYQKDGRKTLCHAVLQGATDAYEWSFVAVPAQPNAGVVKGYKFKEEAEYMSLETVLKSLDTDAQVVLSQTQARALKNHIKRLSKLAEDGKTYAAELKKQVLKLYAQLQPELSPAVLNQVTEKMTIEELKAFAQAGRQTLDGKLKLSPQLAAGQDQKSNHYSDFLI